MRLDIAASLAAVLWVSPRLTADDKLDVKAALERSIPVELVNGWLDQNFQVFIFDPFYLGESKIAERDFLHALQLSCVEDRPLGAQAAQIAAIAQWSRGAGGPSHIVAIGPRTSLGTLVASAAADVLQVASQIELHDSLASLKQVLGDNLGVNQIPEYFRFGLLEHFDIVSLAALSAPSRATFVNPSDRLKTNVAPLAEWYKLHLTEYTPTQVKEAPLTKETPLTK